MEPELLDKEYKHLSEFYKNTSISIRENKGTDTGREKYFHKNSPPIKIDTSKLIVFT